MSNVVDPNAPLRDFIVSMTKLVEKTNDEATLLKIGEEHLAKLISNDEWLHEFCTVPHPEFYQQFLLHSDPLERFSVVRTIAGSARSMGITVEGL